MKSTREHLLQAYGDGAANMVKCATAHASIAGAHRALAKSMDGEEADCHNKVADGHEALASACTQQGEQYIAYRKAIDGADKAAGVTDPTSGEAIRKMVSEQIAAVLAKTIVPDNIRGVIPTDTPFGINAVTRTGQPALPTAKVDARFAHLVAIEEDMG